MSAPLVRVDPWLRGTLHIRISQLVLALSAFSGVALVLTGKAVFVGIPGVLGTICLVGILAEWGKRRVARLAIRTMQQEGSWLYWKVPDELWAAHVKREVRNLPRMTLRMGLLAAFVVALVTMVGPYLSGWAPQPNGGDLRIVAPDGRAFATVFLGLFLFIGLALDLLQAAIYRAVARKGSVALIGPKGVIVGGEFLPLSKNFFLRFRGVVITPPPHPVLELHFREGHVRYNTGAGALSTHQGNRILSLPIPPGWDEDALRVRDSLGSLPE